MTATSGVPSRMPYLAQLHHDLQVSAVPWQWVVAVDGAPATVLPAPVRADPRVTVVTLPRRCGAAAARNVALTHAHGRWVTCADDDDRLPPEAKVGPPAD